MSASGLIVYMQHHSVHSEKWHGCIMLPWGNVKVNGQVALRCKTQFSVFIYSEYIYLHKDKMQKGNSAPQGP